MTHPVSGVRHTALVLAWLLVGAAGARAEDSLQLRLFLRDGTSIATYGEYARVDDRVVFSVALGGAPGEPSLQLVSLPESQVDWPRSDRYLQSVRAARYAVTRGEQDFAAMTGEVARVLNEIALTDDSARKLQLAESARRTLAEWPRDHFGYRAREAQEIAWLLDEAVAELRSRAGQPIDLALVAPVVPATQPLLPPPTLSERIAQALSLADLVDNADERRGLLQSTIALIDRAPAGSAPAAALARAREFASDRLGAELRVDRDYRQLVRDIRRRAERRAARADVRGLSALVARVERADRRLGQRRPEVVRTLLADVRERLDAARRLRLARDQWSERVALYRSYDRLVRDPIAQLSGLQPSLEDIRQLAGPAPEALARLVDRTSRVGRQLHAVVPPTEVAPVHALFVSACEMAANAARIRREAVRTGELSTAWNASAAASGALMLLARARGDLESLLAPPSAR